DAAMRKRCVLAEAAKYSAFDAKVMQCRGTIGGEFLLRHSIAHRGPGGAIRNQQDVIRSLQQGNLRRRFEHATAGGNRRGANEFQSRRRLPNSVVEKEAHALFNSDSATANSTIAKDFSDASIGDRKSVV